MGDTPLVEPELPPSLRFLKRLVTVLTLVMIVGVITIVALIVTRLPQVSAPMPAGAALPEGLALPEGAKVAAVTFGTGWIAVVTTDERILIFAPDGSLKQILKIDMKAP